MKINGICNMHELSIKSYNSTTDRDSANNRLEELGDHMIKKIQIYLRRTRIN